MMSVAFAAAVVLVAVAALLVISRKQSLRAAYAREVARALAPTAPPPALTEADLAPLPPAVQRYLRLSGAVGRPRVVNVRARMHGRIRGGPGARWMAFRAEQVNTCGAPSRLFFMQASLFGVPVAALHRYVGPRATMVVRAASLVTVADARGPEMDQAETVTLFNDMCFLAPASLVDPAIRWGEGDDRSVRATYANGGHTIGAVLRFDEQGELVDFVSDDRFRTSADGKTFTRTRWSTPAAGYRSFGEHRLLAGGAARWHAPEGEFAYIEIQMDDVEYNVAADAAQDAAP